MSGDSIATISAANLTVQIGVDPNPTSRLIGPPAITGQTTAVQRFGNLLPGVTYTLQIVVTTVLGDTISDYSRIPCRAVY